MGDISNELASLKMAIEKQNKLQEQATALTRGSTEAIEGLAQVIADTRERATTSPDEREMG